MPRRALIEHRPWLLASLIAAASYFFVRDDPVPGLWLALWKASGVGLLAGYAWQRAKGFDGILIALVLGLGAAGDFLLEFYLFAGGVVFACAHLVAIGLFLRNPRARRTSTQLLAALALLGGVPLIAALLTYPLENWQFAALYAAISGTMAATAWSSRFPRYRVGLGAVLFAVSDLVIFAREGHRLDPAIAGWLVWPLYYAGQFLIATGVVQTLRHETAGPRHVGIELG